jgi:hypothetical protein
MPVLRWRAGWRRVGGACAALVALAGLGLVLSACGGANRSVDAYCRTFYATANQIVAQYTKVDKAIPSNPFAALGSLLNSPNVLAQFFTRLEQVAPTTIEPSVATLQRSFAKESTIEGQALSDPLAALGEGFLNGLSSMGASTQVTHWTTSHCGPPPGTKWLSGA